MDASYQGQIRQNQETGNLKSFDILVMKPHGIDKQHHYGIALP